MSVAGSQQRTFLHLAAQLRPFWRSDRNLPARIQSLLAANRSFGSRDRRLYRELTYTALRYLPWVEPLLEARPEAALKIVAWLAADIPATRKFRDALVADWPPCPSDASGRAMIIKEQTQRERSPASSPADAFDASALLPKWFNEHCPAAFEPTEITALLSRAPLWLRLQTSNEAEVFAEFEQLGWRWSRSPVLASALRVFDEVDVTKTRSYQGGLIEIQDLGSQLLLEAAGIVKGERWLDACAGAGGKTLQLARLLGSAGHVDAYDIRAAALQELSARATRARISNISPTHGAPAGTYDGVLVDAPCSGSGTWRRAPHLKWTTTPEPVQEAARVQLSLLTQFSAHVRRGGRLLYATCSLSALENGQVVETFLSRQPNFASEEPAQSFGAPSRNGALTFLPSLHDTDGFYLATLRRVT